MKNNNGKVITVSTKAWNWLDKQKRLLKNEHEDNILRLIKDSKEYRGVHPDASYPEVKKWETRTVKVSDDLYMALNVMRGQGIIRTGEAEYSYPRIMNDLINDSEKLNEMEQTAMQEVDKIAETA